MPTADDYVEAGLYDPEERAHAGRLELLDWLVERGFSIEDLQRRVIGNAYSGIAGDARIVPGERLDRASAIARSGLSDERFDAYATAFGFVPIQGAPPGEVGYTVDEVDAFAAAGALAMVFSPDESLGLVRVIASSLGRIAEATVSLFLHDVEAPSLRSGVSELELAEKVFDAAGLLDGFMHRLDPILRRHVLQAVERSRRSSVDDPFRSQYRYAVGFVDLVGFTGLSAKMPPVELAQFVARFEGRAHDIVTAVGARVVKLIGDEVMFVATDPAAACRAGRALVDAFVGDGAGVRPRGGLALGNVVLRGGDYYGPIVNLASRLVDEAVPLELLVTAELAEQVPRFGFEPAGRRMVKGFDEPVAVWSLDAGVG
jgi:class 3 adenylate cyclase